MEPSRPGSRALTTSASILPGQAMASIEELQQQLFLNSENLPLKVNILSSILSKIPNNEQSKGMKLEYLKQKIALLIEANSFNEAETDASTLLALEPSDENKLLHCQLLYKKQDYLNCMTQLLKLKNANTSTVFEQNVEELLNCSYFDTLYIIPNLPDLYSSQITFFPELRGKVILQICSSAYQTYILVSTCPHLACKTGCPLGLYNCSEELQLLEVSNSILAPIDFLSNQKISMVSCSDSMNAVLHRSGRITLWGELPDNQTHLILETRCREISVGGSFMCLINDASIEFWGRLGSLSTIDEDYSRVVSLGDLTGSVVCSDNHILLLSGTSAYSIGVGEEGQLGLGEEVLNIQALTLIEIPQNVVQVLCNNEVSVAITREVIYVWGIVNPLQLNGAPPIAWRPSVLDSFDLEHVAATLSKFEMLVLGKDQVLYSWIWKEDTKLKKYRKIDIVGICALSLRGSEAFLVKRIAIPQLTQIVNFSNTVYSTVAFPLTLTLHDQFGPSFIPDAGIKLSFTRSKASTENEVEHSFSANDDDDGNTILIITAVGFGELWLHIFIENQEIMSSPVQVNVLPSPSQEVLLRQLEYLRELQEMIKNKKEQRARKRIEEKEKAIEDREKKMERTRKRANEALKHYLDQKEKDLLKKEAERQRRLKVKTGGGYVIPY